MWAFDNLKGFSKKTLNYYETVMEYYRIFWENDIPADLISPEHDYSKMLYILAEKIGEQLKCFV